MSKCFLDNKSALYISKTEAILFAFIMKLKKYDTFFFLVKINNIALINICKYYYYLKQLFFNLFLLMIKLNF